MIRFLTSNTARTTGPALHHRPGLHDPIIHSLLPKLDAASYWSLLRANAHHFYELFSPEIALSSILKTLETTHYKSKQRDAAVVMSLLDVLWNRTGISDSSRHMSSSRLATTPRQMRGLLLLAHVSLIREPLNRGLKESILPSWAYRVVMIPSLFRRTSALTDRVIWEDDHVIRLVVGGYNGYPDHDTALATDLGYLGMKYLDDKGYFMNIRRLCIDIAVANYDNRWIGSLNHFFNAKRSEFIVVACLHVSVIFVLWIHHDADPDMNQSYGIIECANTQEVLEQEISLLLPGIDVLTKSVPAVWDSIVTLREDIRNAGCLIGEAAKEVYHYRMHPENTSSQYVKSEIFWWLKRCAQLLKQGQVRVVQP